MRAKAEAMRAQQGSSKKGSAGHELAAFMSEWRQTGAQVLDFGMEYLTSNLEGMQENCPEGHVCEVWQYLIMS